MSKLGGVVIAALFACASAQAQNPTANVAVDANANRRAINPNVYGLAYATSTQFLSTVTAATTVAATTGR